MVAGCAKIVGIDDYKLKDAGEPDTPTDGDIDAPFGVYPAYIKASNAGANDTFGTAMAISADGSTLVVGASEEDSNATGIDGDQANNTGTDSGAVYVFVRMGTTWMQQAYLKASNTGGNDAFGISVAVSGDGSTIAVGAIGEDSSAVGIDGNQASNAVASSGAVYVFARTGSTWMQQAYVKPSNTDTGDEFGTAVALSGDGSTLAVGAENEDSNAIGINGDQDDADPQMEGTDFGAAYVFVRAGGTWVQQAYIKASNSGSGDNFGTAVQLSTDGDTLAVGAQLEDSNALDVNGNQSSNTSPDAGAAYVYKRVNGIWAQQAYLKASNTGSQDQFGANLALSGDGNTIAIGAIGEDSNAVGINGTDNNSASTSGAVYVFAQVASVWTAQAYVKPSNTASNDQFGFSVALSANGDSLLVGGYLEDSAADGLGGSEGDNTAADAGAAYLFARSGTTWAQSLYIKATNSEAQDHFGHVVAGAGSLFVISAPQEDSAATGVGGDQTSNAASNAGAIYVVQ
jgi:hypothetical protein